MVQRPGRVLRWATGARAQLGAPRQRWKVPAKRGYSEMFATRRESSRASRRSTPESMAPDLPTSGSGLVATRTPFANCMTCSDRRLRRFARSAARPAVSCRLRRGGSTPRSRSVVFSSSTTCWFAATLRCHGQPLRTPKEIAVRSSTEAAFYRLTADRTAVPSGSARPWPSDWTCPGLGFWSSSSGIS